VSEPQKTNDTPDGRSTTFQATQGGGEMLSGGTPKMVSTVLRIDTIE